MYKRSGNITHQETDQTEEKNPVMVEAGKKAALTRKTGIYTLEQHTENLPLPILELFNTVRDHIITLDGSIEERPKKTYVAYKTSQNFVCIQTYKKKITLYLKLNPDDYKPLPPHARDVRNIGHFGTGDLEVGLTDIASFESTKHLITEAYRNIGG